MSDRVSIFVDGIGTLQGGGRGLNYHALRDFATRGGAELARFNVYFPYDEGRGATDAQYRIAMHDTAQRIAGAGAKVMQFKLQRIKDEDTGATFLRDGMSLHMAIDTLKQSRTSDQVILVTADENYARVVGELQGDCKRVAVVAFDNAAASLCQAADVFISGYLIPGFKPLRQFAIGQSQYLPGMRSPRWGEDGGKGRGTVYHYDPNKGFGFLKMLPAKLNGGSLYTDPRDPGSAWVSIYFHIDRMRPGVPNVRLDTLANGEDIFEFRLVANRNSPDPNVPFQADAFEMMGGR